MPPAKGGGMEIIMLKKLLSYAFLLEIFAGILMFIVTKQIIISLLLILSGVLFLLTANLFDNEDKK